MEMQALSDKATENSVDAVMNMTAKILTEHFGRLRRKDTRIARYAEMMATLAKGEEIK